MPGKGLISLWEGCGLVLNRRQFVSSASALTLVMLGGSSVRSTDVFQVPGGRSPEDRLIVGQPHHVLGRKFIALAHEKGWPALPLGADPGSLYRRLATPSELSGPLVAGLTDNVGWVVAWQAARDRNLQLLLHVEHRVLADGTARHDMSGTPAMVRFHRRLLSQFDPVQALGAQVSMPLTSDSARLAYSCETGECHGNDTTGSLHSWILAPRTSRASTVGRS